MKQERAKYIHCKMPQELLDDLKAHCDARDIKIKAFVREAVEQALKRNGGKRGTR